MKETTRSYGYLQKLKYGFAQIQIVCGCRLNNNRWYNGNQMTWIQPQHFCLGQSAFQMNLHVSNLWYHDSCLYWSNDCWFYVTKCTRTSSQFSREILLGKCSIFKVQLIDGAFLVFNLKLADKCIIRFLLFSFRLFKLNCRNSKIGITALPCIKIWFEELFWRSFIYYL